MEAVAHEVRLHAPTEAVWAWLTTAEGMARWHSGHPLAIALDPQVGGRLAVSGAFHGLDLALEGEVLEAQAPTASLIAAGATWTLCLLKKPPAAWCDSPWSQLGQAFAEFGATRRGTQPGGLGAHELRLARGPGAHPRPGRSGSFSPS